MSDTAREHIKRIHMPWTLKSLVFLIADYHNVKEGKAWPGINELAEVTGLSGRHIRRLLKQICDDYSELIRYTPGRGRGNFGSVEFLKLRRMDADVRFYRQKEDTKEDIKGDIPGSVIRKEPRTTEPSPETPRFEIPKSVQERNERERRGRLTAATRRGLRDFKRYPREPWEEVS